MFLLFQCLSTFSKYSQETELPSVQLWVIIQAHAWGELQEHIQLLFKERATHRGTSTAGFSYKLCFPLE